MDALHALRTLERQYHAPLEEKLAMAKPLLSRVDMNLVFQVRRGGNRASELEPLEPCPPGRPAALSDSQSSAAHPRRWRWWPHGHHGYGGAPPWLPSLSHGVHGVQGTDELEFVLDRALNYVREQVRLGPQGEGWARIHDQVLGSGPAPAPCACALRLRPAPAPVRGRGVSVPALDRHGHASRGAARRGGGDGAAALRCAGGWGLAAPRDRDWLSIAHYE
jgi:hypothetical protein